MNARSSLLLRGCLGCVVVLLCLVTSSRAVTFTNNARLEVPDSSGVLSWKETDGALTVSCWFKLSIPSGVMLMDNMTILVDRTSGNESDTHSYLILFNPFSGNVEFSARGSSGVYSNTLIERPYLDRWYHVAVARQGEAFSSYVDGRVVPGGRGIAGNSASGQGVSIGGFGDGKYLYGEVQEVAIYRSVRDQEFIVGNMFKDQPTNAPSLKLEAYFKLGFSTNSADHRRNFALTAVPSAIDKGSAKVSFEETDQGGEQSAFDSRKNGGRDALAPLSGAFSWNQTALSRPSPGIALDFRYGYSSGNVAGTYKLNSFDPYATGPLSKGWRHSFESRVLPSQAFSPLADTDTIGILNWDGAIETWDLDAATGQYRPRDKEYKGEFFITTTNCQWITPERIVYSFKRPDTGQPSGMRGRLLSIHDFNSNVVRVLWNEDSLIITQVVDSAGGRYDLNYDMGRGFLTNVAFQGWSANFGYDTSNHLASKTITGPTGYTNVNTTWQFFYNPSNTLLEHVVDSRSNTNTTVRYDQYGRKTNEMDALGRATLTRYGVPGNRQITHIDPGTNSWIETYDRKGLILVQRDPLGNETRYTYDERGNRTSITEPLGWKTTFGYDDRANVIARTNALGEVTRWIFHSNSISGLPHFNKPVQEITPQPTNVNGHAFWTNHYEIDDRKGNLVRHSDDLGDLVRYTYRTNGLVETSTDANSRVTSPKTSVSGS